VINGADGANKVKGPRNWEGGKMIKKTENKLIK
jgi:hypothetical protein